MAILDRKYSNFGGESNNDDNGDEAKDANLKKGSSLITFTLATPATDTGTPWEQWIFKCWWSQDVCLLVGLILINRHLACHDICADRLQGHESQGETLHVGHKPPGGGGGGFNCGCGFDFGGLGCVVVIIKIGQTSNFPSFNNYQWRFAEQ